MRILLTGASGFIGRVLLDMMSATHEMIAVVRPGSPALPGAGRIQWDLSSPLQARAFPDKVDAVIHLAASRRFREFPEAVPELLRINVDATTELLEYARTAGASRFFLASTGNVYATDYQLKIDQPPVPPHDFYTASKLAAEALVRPYRSCLNATVFRIFFAYGAGQADRTIPRLLSMVREGQPIRLEGGGPPGSTLSLVYVDDLAAAIATAVEDGWSGLFDMAGPERLSVQEIAEEIGHQIGRAPVFEPAEVPINLMDADLGPLQEHYDLSRFRPFREGLRRLLKDSKS